MTKSTPKTIRENNATYAALLVVFAVPILSLLNISSPLFALIVVVAAAVLVRRAWRARVLRASKLV